MKNLSRPPVTNPYQLIGQVGLTMIACILAGTWAGFKLDAWLDTGGIVTAVAILGGVLLGVVATGLLLYRSIPWKP